MDSSALSDAWPSSPYSSSAPDGEVLRSLHRLARDLSAAEAPAPFLRPVFAAVARRARLLAAVFDDLLLLRLLLPRSASLCLRELLLVLQRFKALVADCAARSRTRLLLQSDEVAARARELQHDLATLLDLLPLPDLGVADDVADLLALASRQCRRAAADPELPLKAGVLALIHDVEREIVPARERLEGVLEEVGINDPASCSDEIETLEREIGDRAAERWTPAMIALVGLLRYAKCVLFSAATPRAADTKVDGASSEADADPDDSAEEPPSPPMDFRCPISLDLMRDPVVASSGQTYDRESITRWFGSGKPTCPKTGQVLPSLELVPNKALKNLIARWCRENGVPVEGGEPGKAEPAPAVAANKAALEAARMTASFLVKKLSASFSPEATRRVVHEIRQLARTGSDNRAFLGEAGAAPLLVPLLRSEDPALRLDAVTALLNLSILDANKKRIMHAEGAVDALCHVMAGSGPGATWRAKENAAATVLSLAAAHAYRRRLGRYPRVVEAVVRLARAGPPSTKKDALAALLCLSGERENVGRLVEAGAAEAALSAVGDAEHAAAAIVALDGAVARLVGEMRRGTEWSRESAAAALVLLCRRAGAAAAAQVTAVPGVEWAIWELLGTGTERARRKAASLGRACRRWAVAANAAEQGAECPTADGAAPAS
ncbi:hypothetical protein BS78_09G177800 [Paspalum vaginatum]|nr:hypothetical protein BS78_09G177800 [Paspalum vaginatum]